MAFSMKVAQGGIEIEKCPHMSEEALRTIGDATAPPMKLLKVGTGDFEQSLGGETVLYRHEKTFVSKTLYGVNVCADSVDAKLEGIKKVDYERIGERMRAEVINVAFAGNADAFVGAVKKALAAKCVLVLDVKDAAAAQAALDVAKDTKPITKT